jgi:hypothetical protein
MTGSIYTYVHGIGDLYCWDSEIYAIVMDGVGSWSRNCLGCIHMVEKSPGPMKRVQR